MAAGTILRDVYSKRCAFELHATLNHAGPIGVADAGSPKCSVAWVIFIRTDTAAEYITKLADPNDPPV